MPRRLNRGRKHPNPGCGHEKIIIIILNSELYQPLVSTVFRAGPKGRFTSTKTNEQHIIFPRWRLFYEKFQFLFVADLFVTSVVDPKDSLLDIWSEGCRFFFWEVFIESPKWHGGNSKLRVRYINGSNRMRFAIFTVFFVCFGDAGRRELHACHMDSCLSNLEPHLTWVLDILISPKEQRTYHIS